MVIEQNRESSLRKLIKSKRMIKSIKSKRMIEAL